MREWFTEANGMSVSVVTEEKEIASLWDLMNLIANNVADLLTEEDQEERLETIRFWMRALRQYSRVYPEPDMSVFKEGEQSAMQFEIMNILDLMEQAEGLMSLLTEEMTFPVKTEPMDKEAEEDRKESWTASEMLDGLVFIVR